MHLKGLKGHVRMDRDIWSSGFRCLAFGGLGFRGCRVKGSKV